MSFPGASGLALNASVAARGWRRLAVSESTGIRVLVDENAPKQHMTSAAGQDTKFVTKLERLQMMLIAHRPIQTLLFPKQIRICTVIQSAFTSYTQKICSVIPGTTQGRQATLRFHSVCCNSRLCARR